MQLMLSALLPSLLLKAAWGVVVVEDPIDVHELACHAGLDLKQPERPIGSSCSSRRRSRQSKCLKVDEFGNEVEKLRCAPERFAECYGSEEGSRCWKGNYLCHKNSSALECLHSRDIECLGKKDGDICDYTQRWLGNHREEYLMAAPSTCANISTEQADAFEAPRSALECQSPLKAACDGKMEGQACANFTVPERECKTTGRRRYSCPKNGYRVFAQHFAGGTCKGIMDNDRVCHGFSETGRTMGGCSRGGISVVVLLWAGFAAAFSWLQGSG
mmetsp:Transcript_20592/g.45070  ORF Transcript_20592/g.45070 Transcript_20592/m.45070 type:complete len:273 (+) Transcript_20592:74-892(+)